LLTTLSSSLMAAYPSPGIATTMAAYPS
jgi:hypothetical protein